MSSSENHCQVLHALCRFEQHVGIIVSGDLTAYKEILKRHFFFLSLPAHLFLFKDLPHRTQLLQRWHFAVISGAF